MKRTTMAASVLAAALCGAAPAHAQDGWTDKVGDWFATVGRPSDEKETILAQRRAKRAAEKLESTMRRGVEQARKEMDAFGKELGKLGEDR